MKDRFENTLSNRTPEREAEKAEDIAFIEGLVDEETLARIEELQEKKLEFVQGLRDWRKKFWSDRTLDPEGRKKGGEFELRKGARTLTQMGDNEFEMHLKGGESVRLTKGEVMAASEWGYWWSFDGSVDNEVQREVMSHQVRAVIAEGFDKQLVALGKADRLSNDMKRDAYATMEQNNFTLETAPPGIICEKMLISFLTKEMHDGDLPFTIKKVDVYEDMEHKIDFIITVENVRRGVQVEEPEEVTKIGIQFTTLRAPVYGQEASKKQQVNAQLYDRKVKQLERVKNKLGETEVDELVLINIPLSDVKQKFRRWRYDNQGNRRNERKLDPRGPDHLWSEETKQRIVDGLVKGIQSEALTEAA